MQKIIFMIHGMWGGGWYWENYIHYFERLGYRCIAPTLRYHNAKKGETPDPQLGATSLLDFAEDLEHEVRRLDTEPVMMGHSMGGLLAQILGSRGLAQALVLLTPAPPAGVFSLKPSVLKSFLSGLTTWGFWRKPLLPTFEEAIYSTLNLLPVEEQREMYGKYVYESGRAAFEIGFYWLDKNGAAQVDAEKVICPTLVIAGSRDRITPASVVRKVAKRYKKAEYKEFTDHAHWVVGEPGWEEIAGYAAEWLDNVLD